MKSDWPKDPDIKCIQDFSDWLAESRTHTNRIFRGQAKSCWSLQTSLDRHIQKMKAEVFEEKRQIEEDFITEFRCKARKYLGDREKALIDNADDKIPIMTVMQHFGVPTRLLDWTKSGVMAAYCACIDNEDRNGTIWWVDENAIVESVHNEWKSRGYSRRPHPECSQINLSDHLDSEDVEEFVSASYIRAPFHRAHIQQGLFTFGSRFNLDHDVQLEAQLKDHSYGRVEIPAGLKSEAIHQLSTYGIDGTSLQYTGADRVGLKLAWDREHEAGIDENKDVEDTTK